MSSPYHTVLKTPFPITFSYKMANKNIFGASSPKLKLSHHLLSQFYWPPKLSASPYGPKNVFITSFPQPHASY
jgi:hypothetical protein